MYFTKLTLTKLVIHKKTLKMKTTLIALLIVSLAAILNTKHVIIETIDKEYDDDTIMTENSEETGTIFALLTTRVILIKFPFLMFYSL